MELGTIDFDVAQCFPEGFVDAVIRTEAELVAGVIEMAFDGLDCDVCEVAAIDGAGFGDGHAWLAEQDDNNNIMMIAQALWPLGKRRWLPRAWRESLCTGICHQFGHKPQSGCDAASLLSAGRGASLLW